MGSRATLDQIKDAELPFLTAANMGHWECVAAMFSKSTPMQQREIYLQAVLANQLDIVKKILETDPEVLNHKDASIKRH